MINLAETEYLIHRTALEKGFWSDKHGEDQVNQILAKMMLIDTEVSELADAYVKHRHDEVETEMVDILIRLFDLHQAMKDYGIVNGDIEEILERKMKFNAGRPPKHGRLM